MTLFVQRLALFLLLAVFQYSFLDVLWPSFSAPAAMISLTVSLVFLSGFEHGGLWALFATALFLLLSQDDYTFALFTVLVAYGTGFLSRRLVIERPVQTSFVLASASAGFAAGYIVISALISRQSFDTGALFGNILQTMLVFPVMFLILKTWEKFAKESAMSEFRGMRT